MQALLADTDFVTVARLGGDPPVTFYMRGPTRERASREFPTDILQKGLLVRRGSCDLCGEGMGFALPVVVYKGRSVFPGRAAITLHPRRADRCEPVALTARYDLCMMQSLFLGGRSRIESQAVYRLREKLSCGAQTKKATGALRATCARLLMALGRVRLDYEEYESFGTITVHMAVDSLEATVDVVVDVGELTLRGAVVSCLNELDGRLFDRYVDSAGIELYSEEIGIWDRVAADQAWLGAPHLGLGFGISNVQDAEVYRGRETSDPTLAWAGFACVARADAQARTFRYKLAIDGPGLAMQ